MLYHWILYVKWDITMLLIEVKQKLHICVCYLALYMEHVNKWKQEVLHLSEQSIRSFTDIVVCVIN